MTAFSAQTDMDDTASVLRRVLTKDGTQRKQRDPSGETLAPLVLTPELRVDAPAVTTSNARKPRGMASDASGRVPEASSAVSIQHHKMHGHLVTSMPAQSAPAAGQDVVDVIDEAMLQTIVAQFVRQELQGELGEKITHSIRKLVRAELARELRLRDLSDHSSNG